MSIRYSSILNRFAHTTLSATRPVYHASLLRLRGSQLSCLPSGSTVLRMLFVASEGNRASQLIQRNDVQKIVSAPDRRAVPSDITAIKILVSASCVEYVGARDRICSEVTSLPNP